MGQRRSTSAASTSNQEVPTFVYEAHSYPGRTGNAYRRFPTSGWLQDWIALRKQVLNPTNLKIWAWALLWEGCAIAFHGWCAKQTYIRGVIDHNMVGTPPLFDLVHENVPNLQWARLAPELGTIGSVLYLAGLMLYNFDERSLDCFRTVLWAHGVILITRAISFSSTLLPDASQQCHDSKFIGGCHDLIFSGHIALMTLCVACTLHFFFPHPAVRVVLVLNACLQTFLVAATRNHYTVDVVVAVVVAIPCYIAFTRHPVLVSLTTYVPAKVRGAEKSSGRGHELTHAHLVVFRSWANRP